MQKDVGKKIKASAMMITLVVVLFIPFVNLNTGSIVTQSARDNIHWWNPDWSNRKLIVIDHTKVSANLINFPILLSRTSDADLADAAQNTGRDIAFILYSDNITKLNHEIEFFNHTNGQLIAWVNMTTVSSTSDTKLWMYYGNTNCSDQQQVEDTWDSNFLAVQHLEEIAGTIYDSTTYNHDGTPYGDLSQNIIGKIDGADSFDGINDHITLPTVYTTENQFTIESWIYAQPGSRHFISQRSNNSLGVFIQILGDNYIQYYINGISDITGITLNNWHYIVLTYDGSMAHLYVNSVAHSIYCSVPTWPSEGMCLGDRLAGNRQYHGTLDEVRFSKIARNYSWLNTTYNNENNPESFISVGTEEQYEYTLTLIVNPTEGGALNASPAPPYHFNDTVTLTATPNQGYLFDHWEGDLTGDANPASLIINENKTVIASFVYQSTMPVAMNDSATVVENSSDNTIDVLVNDYDPDGDNLTIVSLTQPLHGASSQDGVFVYYTPLQSYTGSDFFTYTITDGQDGNSSATVFITVTPLNTPPNTPSNPTPYNGAVDVSISTDLSWSGGDPDAGDTVRYDVYFGTSSPPILVSANQSTATYNLGVLAYNTTYFWRIVSWDSHDASADGPLWSFTTQSGGDEGIVVNITRPLENSLYIRNLRLFSLRRTTVVYGPITIKAEVTSDSEVDRVEFFVDGKLKKIDTREPYTYRWAPLRCFKHTITVIAYDVDSNSASDEVTVFKWRLHPILLLSGAYVLMNSMN